MPWVALAFSDRDRKNRLSAKYKVQGIPSLVILDPSGELITDAGRAAVMQDPKGNNFPWKPKSPLELLGNGTFVTKDGSKKTLADISKNVDVIGLYFSASWCGPCHRFTPILSGVYKALAAKDAAAGKNKRFEVIFLSSDRDQGSFNKYYADMPWVALDFADGELKEQLEERYKVEGIPTLVVIDAKTGQSLNEDTVGAVAMDPQGANFPWAPKPVEVLSSATAGSIGPSPALFVFCGSDAKAKELQPDLISAVDVWRGKVEEGAVCHGDVCIPTGGKVPGSEDVQFFVCGDDPIVARVQDLAKARGVVVAILDLSGPVYAHADIASIDKATPVAIRKFLHGYLNGTVQKLKVTQM